MYNSTTGVGKYLKFLKNPCTYTYVFYFIGYKVVAGWCAKLMIFDFSIFI